jgi:hypothetical protein
MHSTFFLMIQHDHERRVKMHILTRERRKKVSYWLKLCHQGCSRSFMIRTKKAPYIPLKKQNPSRALPSSSHRGLMRPGPCGESPVYYCLLTLLVWGWTSLQILQWTYTGFFLLTFKNVVTYFFWHVAHLNSHASLQRNLHKWKQHY